MRTYYYKGPVEFVSSLAFLMDMMQILGHLVSFV